MWRWLLATFFILTFCIGSSFITLPFGISAAGFWPAVIALVISWAYLLITSFYYLEATLAFPAGANVYSISRRLTGEFGVWLNSITLVVVTYCDLIFYFYFGVPIFAEILRKGGIPMPEFSSYFFFVVILGVSVFLGLKWTLKINFLLLILLGLFFYLSFISGVDMKSSPIPAHFEWGLLFLAIPSLISSLYFQTLIPSLASYLDNDIKKLKSACITGLTIAWLLLGAWLLAIITKVSGTFENLDKLASNAISYNALIQIPGFGRWLPYLLCASFSANTLASSTILVDFFSDMFQISSKQRKKSLRML